ncbi:MAG: hypothetical protein ACXW5U_08215 [Thermoanaerobaculia bacterium]
MKGCARTCLLQLLGWGVVSYAFYFYLQSLGDLGTPLYWASIGAGLFAMIAIGYAWAIKDLFLERKVLLEAASGTPPEDGRWVAVGGRIHSMHSLHGPLTGEDVVAYQYKISRMERSGKSSSEVTYYDGKALVPSTISTPHGSIRLLAVPTFDVPAATFERYVDTLERAREYVAATPFQTSKTPKNEKIGMEHESTDDDGNFRVDKRWSEREVDLDGFTFEEKHIRQNEPVCAFGLYSQQRGGLIPHPNWAKQTRIMRGDAHDVANQLRTRIIKYVIGIVCFSAAAM